MDRILLIEKPWVSKDATMLVGGHPLATISLNSSHAKDLKKLLEDGYLTIDKQNQELCDTLLEHEICRPILNLSEYDVESVSDQILLCFHVTLNTDESQQCLVGLLRGESPFELSQILFSAQSLEAWRRFCQAMLKLSIALPSELPDLTTSLQSRTEKYFVSLTRPIDISPLKLKLLILELIELGSDLIVPRIIGRAAPIGSNYTSTAISHYEEHNFIFDLGKKWTRLQTNGSVVETSFPLIAGTIDIIGMVGTARSLPDRLNVTSEPSDMSSSKLDQRPLSLVFEPDIIARDFDTLTLSGFVHQALEFGRQLANRPENQDLGSPAKLGASNLVNLFSTLSFGKFGIGVSALTSALQLAYVSQKLAVQPYGDLAALHFVYRSNLYTFSELNGKLRRSVALPISLLMPFSKLARRIGLGLILLRVIEISKTSDKEELPANLLLASIQDIAISTGIWTTAAARRSPTAAIPDIKLTRWQKRSNYVNSLFARMESQQPTN